MPRGKSPKRLYMYSRDYEIIKIFDSCDDASRELNIRKKLIRIAAYQECAARRKDSFIFSFNPDLQPRENKYIKRWEEREHEDEDQTLQKIYKTRKCNICDKSFASLNSYRSCPECTVAKRGILDTSMAYGTISLPPPNSD